MSITLELGWWILPAAVFAGNVVWLVWPRPDEWNNRGAYSWPDGMFMFPFRAMVAAITTLIAIVVWRW